MLSNITRGRTFSHLRSMFGWFITTTSVALVTYTQLRVQCVCTEILQRQSIISAFVVSCLYFQYIKFVCNFIQTRNEMQQIIVELWTLMYTHTYIYLHLCFEMWYIFNNLHESIIFYCRQMKFVFHNLSLRRLAVRQQCASLFNNTFMAPFWIHFKKYSITFV